MDGKYQQITDLADKRRILMETLTPDINTEIPCIDYDPKEQRVVWSLEFDNGRLWDEEPYEGALVCIPAIALGIIKTPEPWEWYLDDRQREFLLWWIFDVKPTLEPYSQPFLDLESENNQWRYYFDLLRQNKGPFPSMKQWEQLKAEYLKIQTQHL